MIISNNIQLEWKEKGLNSTINSIENISILQNNIQHSIIIDPSGDILNFLKVFLKDVKIIKGNQEDISTQVINLNDQCKSKIR